MKFILRRLAFYAVAAWVALTVNFFIPRAMPGNAVRTIMAKFPDLQPSAYRALQAMLGVGNPGSLWDQYVAYLGNVVHLNFGTDLTEYPAKVSTLLARDDPVDPHPGRHRDRDRVLPRHRRWASSPAGGTAAGPTGGCPD